MAESSKTFFSYAREDSEFVLRPVRDLRAAGAAVWLDVLDISPSMRWVRDNKPTRPVYGRVPRWWPLKARLLRWF